MIFHCDIYGRHWQRVCILDVLSSSLHVVVVRTPFSASVDYQSIDVRMYVLTFRTHESLSHSDDIMSSLTIRKAYFLGGYFTVVNTGLRDCVQA